MAVDKRKIRVIDHNTNYDVPARLIHLARQIRDGKIGAVTDVVVCVHVAANDDGHTEGYHFGKSHISMAMMMLDKVKSDLT